MIEIFDRETSSEPYFGSNNSSVRNSVARGIGANTSGGLLLFEALVDARGNKSLPEAPWLYLMSACRL